jgi:hypothetical protein
VNAHRCPSPIKFLTVIFKSNGNILIKAKEKVLKINFVRLKEAAWC